LLYYNEYLERGGKYISKKVMKKKSDLKIYDFKVFSLEEIRKEEEQNSPREVIKVEPLPVQLTEEEIKVKKIKAIEALERIRELMEKYPTPNNIENMKKDESDY
jgi:hypothetical protein